MSQDPQNDPRLRSPWGPVRAALGWWAKPITDAVTHGSVVDVETGSMNADFGRYVATDLIGRGIRLLTETAAASGVDPAAIAQTQATAMRLQSWAPAWAHYVACGRQLFDFTPGLVEALNHTDLGETRLAGLESPYKAFYVRFGAQPHLGLPWEDKTEYVDGAFFSFQQSPGQPHPTVLICLSMVFADGLGMLSPGPSMAIPGEYFDLPVQEALDRAVKDAEDQAREIHVGLMKNPQGPVAGMGPAMLSEGLETAGIFRRALPLLVNCLYYLSDPPKAEAVPSHDAPVALSAKVVQSATPNAQRKALTTLFGHGYAMVRLCGREFETQANSMRGASVKAHWRRGHYRDQRYGPALAMVRRIWIRPVKVNPGEPEAADGHIYVADKLPDSK